MAELVDACVSGAHAARCAGSSPVPGTEKVTVVQRKWSFNGWLSVGLLRLADN